uniref:Uncharacterized protein n=1 Tax=Pyxicephalus adspersus TaxID=30357 RepID=A0AAV3AU96_PYXAD|nr:TPA: hypothetical protein GDO54_006160 [Pyxicephalus adspersus]
MIQYQVMCIYPSHCNVARGLRAERRISVPSRLHFVAVMFTVYKGSKNSFTSFSTFSMASLQNVMLQISPLPTPGVQLCSIQTKERFSF